MGYAHDYADAIMHRGRVPMEPADFVPDWADRPRKGKYYPGAESFPLPRTATSPSDASAAAGCLPGQQPPATGQFSLPLLAGMLRDSYGLVGPAARRPGQHRPGGAAALHPGELVPRHRLRRRPLPGQRLLGRRSRRPAHPRGLPLRHHRHAMQRLLTGDVTGRGAGGARAGRQEGRGHRPVPGPRHQVLAERLQVQQLLLPRRQHGRRPLLQTLADLGARARAAARARAVVRRAAAGPAARRLRGGGGRLRRRPAALGERDPAPGESGSDVRKAPADRPAQPGEAPSAARVAHARRRTLPQGPEFEILESVRAATAEHAEPGRNPARSPPPGPCPCPTPATASAAAAPRGAADPAPGPAGPPQQLRPVRRHTPRRRRPTGHRAGRCRGRDAGDRRGTARPGAGWPSCTSSSTTSRASPPGAYEYDPEAARPASRRGRPARARSSSATTSWPTTTWNRPARCSCPPSARTPCWTRWATAATGWSTPRSGAVAQTFYTAAAALGLGCGRGARLRQRLLHRGARPGATGETPLLIMLLGHERPAPADFRYEIA